MFIVRESNYIGPKPRRGDLTRPDPSHAAPTELVLGGRVPQSELEPAQPASGADGGGRWPFAESSAWCPPPALTRPLGQFHIIQLMSTLYKDGLVEITDQEVVFHRYYFPFGGDKHVPLSQIESIEVRQPSIAFGSWRIWGGGPRTWFPLDGARPSRDAIFVAFLRGCFMRIGFTVEHSKEATEVFRQRGLLHGMSA